MRHFVSIEKYRQFVKGQRDPVGEVWRTALTSSDSLGLSMEQIEDFVSKDDAEARAKKLAKANGNLEIVYL